MMIAVDAMGGDFAPRAPIKGALEAAHRGIHILLCGPEEVLVHSLFELDRDWEKLPITIVDAPDVIGMAEDPVRAVRKKEHSSLHRALRLVATGEADAVFSAGNSGAVMAGALFLIGRQEGVRRPAIAGLLPSLKGYVVALDLGANVDCKPEFLVQFAHMGVAYARVDLGVDEPRVGLLSNGSERGKGSALVKEAGRLLEQENLSFAGNVEPIDIINHSVDVVVCDGFSGNILLKTMEATAHIIKVAAERELSSGNIVTGEAVRRMESEMLLAKIDARFGEAAHTGARLLGVRGIVLVGHGSADAGAIARGIQNAWKMACAEK